MSYREDQLRALLLALALPVAASIIGSVFFIAGPLYGRLGLLVSLFFGLIGLYKMYFELPESISDTVHGVELDESETAGIRPDPGERGFDLDVGDLILSQLPPKRVAQVIYNSPDWHSDGHGDYSTWLRLRLRRLFHLELTSNKVFEFSIFGLTILAVILLYFVFLSFIPDSMTQGIIEPLTEIYPSNQPFERTLVIMVVSAIVAFAGTGYFTIKSDSTCPVCHSPFALQSKKQFFKPQNREVITVTQDGNSEKKEVTYGVHIFHCESCGSWHVPTNRWERSIDSQRL